MNNPVPFQPPQQQGQDGTGPFPRYTMLMGSAHAPVDPWAASAAIYGAFGPLDAQRQAVQQYFATAPYAGFQAAQWGFHAPLVNEQRTANALRLVEDTLRGFGALPPAPGQEGQLPARVAQAPAGFGSEFIQAPNVSADIVRQLLDYKPMSTKDARNFMRLARAMGPENAFVFGMLTGQISPGMALAIRGGGPMPILAALPAVSAVDAARLQAMGQAMPAAYQSVTQLALAPLTAEMAMADRRLAAAEILQRPYIEGMRVYGGVAPQLLGAAATAPITASDFLSRHQALALQTMSQLAQQQAAMQ